MSLRSWLTRDRCQEKTKCDTIDTAELDVVLAEHRIDDIRQERHEDDDGQRVEVVLKHISTGSSEDVIGTHEKVIWSALGGHR